MMVIDQNIGREDSSNKPANYSVPKPIYRCW
jgi:hypothetical protein